MPLDVSVVVSVDGHEYEARILNQGDVQVYIDDSMVGGGLWRRGHIVERTPSLASTVYDAVEAVLRNEVRKS